MKKSLFSKVDQCQPMEHINKDIIINEESIRDIAVVGISINFPNAKNSMEFWNNIKNKKECIHELSEYRLKEIIEYLNCIGMSKSDIEFEKAAYLEDIDKFDYNFFGIAYEEAYLIDPNHRFFIETVWNAIEDSGYGGSKLEGSRTGIYMSIGDENQYKRLMSDAAPELLPYSIAGIMKPFAGSRISHMLDLRGPNMVIDSTCSSSLVAIQLACESLRNQNCDLAIAGAVKINLFPIVEVINNGIHSPDGKTRSFDKNANGAGSGEGVAAIILKPLNNAIEDRDNIYAIIKGGAINHDGRSVGLTAPNPIAQEDVINRAWKDAAIDPLTISYIEAHGTGTKFGDPIEIEGITKAFRRYTDKKQFVAISSVKPNIGHLVNASGMASIIKVILALKHQEIPPQINFETPNEQINFKDSPVYVNTESKEWKVNGFPRRCGVSSFSMSGTNCHIILEEAPKIEKAASLEESYPKLLLISAKSKSTLIKLIEEYISFIMKDQIDGIDNMCYMAMTGRWHYNYRIAIVFRDKSDLIKKLEEITSHGFEKIENYELFYGKHEIVSNKNEEQNFIEITEEERKMLSKTLSNKIKIFVEDNNVELLYEISNLYVKGANTEWEELYKGKTMRKISIPTYQFEKTKCWLNYKKGKVYSN